MNATELLVQLRSRGVLIEAAGDRLKVDAPKGAVTPELREALAEHKLEVLAFVTIAEDEIAWRVAAMLPQVPSEGPIPFLVAKQGCKSEAGRCLSCGSSLREGDAYRCAICSRAVKEALGLAMLKI